MSILDEAVAQEQEPLICTIAGAAGTGKTTLASTFPKPFMIRTQGERVPDDAPYKMKSIGVTETTESLWNQLKALLQDQHDYQTLVVDSVTGLDDLFTKEVLDHDPKARGIVQALGGWGAGRAAVAANHSRLRRAAEMLKDKRGMNVVFLAHAEVTQNDPPDGESFTMYSLRLHKTAMPFYIDKCCLVGFLKQTTILTGGDGSRKAKTTGEVSLVTYLTPAFVCKNRLGIKDDLDVKHGENPLAPWMKLNTKKKEIA